MAQQGTEEKTGSTGDEGAAQEPAAGESTGRHAASETTGTTEASASGSSDTSAPSEQQKPAEAETEKVEKPVEPKTEKVGKPAPAAEPEHPRHRSVDIGELAWRTGNVLATVVRTLALLFALVLVVNVVLVLVGVNPANGVAQFVSAVANIVIVGFRDLFIPANPVFMLVVNSLVAAVFWVFVGELVSRLIRFVAARVK
jgi:hypothetical protein